MTQPLRFSRALPALLVAGALSIPLLASCGGGGGSSSSATTATSTPVPTATSISTVCDNSTFAPNYARSVLLLRWQVFPLRVFFVQDAELSAPRRALALAGFNQWVRATNNRADYTVVTNESSANVRVSFYRFTGGSGDTLGTTTVSYNPSNNVIVRASVELGITGNTAEDTSTAAHEWGHVLGITSRDDSSGHSPNQLDLMFFTGNRSGEVTTSDLNTVLTGYCGNFNRSTARTSAAVGPLKTIVMH